jgi:hypothetical protein
MTGKEILDEVEWMIWFQVSPIEIGKALDREPTSLERLAYRHGRDEIARYISSYEKDRGWGNGRWQ